MAVENTIWTTVSWVSLAGDAVGVCRGRVGLVGVCTKKVYVPRKVVISRSLLAYVWVCVSLCLLRCF